MNTYRPIQLLLNYIRVKSRPYINFSLFYFAFLFIWLIRGEVKILYVRIRSIRIYYNIPNERFKANYKLKYDQIIKVRQLHTSTTSFDSKIDSKITYYLLLFDTTYR